MILEIKISPICQPIKFFLAKRKIKINIGRSFSIVSELFIWNFHFFDLILINPYSFNPSHHLLLPIRKRVFPFFSSDEIFKLHDLKLSGTESEIAWRYFIPKCFAYLGNAKRQFRMK